MINGLDCNNLKFEYIVCAVVFGTDISILNVSLKDGFSFVRRSLIPGKDHLDSIFDTTTMGLQRSYQTALIDSESLDVICIEKHVQISLKNTASQQWYETQVDQDLISLDNQIRAIRLFCECPLRCKLVSFNMESEQYEYGTMSFSSIIPISESSGTREISKFHCGNDDLLNLNKKIAQMSFPIGNNILNSAHRFYDLSYHQENFVSITLLIVALEMIFLNEDAGKKDRLSKRCSVFMCDSQEDRVECYKKLLAAYKQRSDFVHDGVFTGIKDETILFLRKCVRQALTSIEPKSFEKKAFISDLKKKVGETDCWKTD